MNNLNEVKRIISILLFLFYSQIFAQNLTVINKNSNILKVKSSDINFELKENENKTISNIKEVSLSNNGGLSQDLNFFINSNEKITITITNQNTIEYFGDRDSLHVYLSKLNVVTYGELKSYYKYYHQEKSTTKYISTSEVLLANIFKRINELNKSGLDEKTNKSLADFIKYNWLYTVFLGLTNKSIEPFQKEIVPYYYKKYIESDISNYQCQNNNQYEVLKYLSKYKKELGIGLPAYDLVSPDDQDNINQYLPKSCQRYYFEGSYKYLNHIDSPDKERYKKVLNNQFHLNVQ